MANKALSPAAIIAIIVVAIIVIGAIGYKAVSGSRTGPNGVDLSKAGVQPGGATPYAQKK